MCVCFVGGVVCLCAFPRVCAGARERVRACERARASVCVCPELGHLEEGRLEGETLISDRLLMTFPGQAALAGKFCLPVGRPS